jgi:hypothetical protein
LEQYNMSDIDIEEPAIAKKAAITVAGAGVVGSIGSVQLLEVLLA